MGSRSSGSAWVAAVAVGAACVLIRTALSVEVDPGSYQGRTEAAIRDFREAVALEPNLEHGKTLFTICAECHQADGGGSADGRIPVIAGQHVSVVVKQLVDFRHDRRWQARMQNALKKHELGQPTGLLDVAAYAESLKRPVSAGARRRRRGRRSWMPGASLTATARAATDGSPRATCARCGRASPGRTTRTCCASSSRRPTGSASAWTRST